MMASELINKLQDLVHQYGDCLVVNDEDEQYSTPEFNDDADPPVIILEV